MDHLAAIRSESERFYDIAGTADPTVAVPSCPAWTIADLVRHLGEVHWFWSTDIEMRAAGADEVERLAPAPPADHDGSIAFGRSQAERLLGVLDATADDVRVWTWALDEADHTVGFIRRHQAQEAAVHRWDLERAATGAAAPIDPVVAADSIDEMLSVTVPWVVDADRQLPGTIHLHCTDTEGEWLLHTDGRVDRVHAKGDVAMRATASDLLLALYGRVGLDAIDLIGDASLAQDLVARISTE